MIHRRFRERHASLRCRRRPVRLLLLLAAISATAVAQPTSETIEKPAPEWEIRPLVFGVLLSPGSILHETSFSVLPGSDACGSYQSASTFALSPDVFALWRLPSAPQWWIGLRAGYRNLSTHLVSTESVRAFQNAFANEVQFGTMVTRYDLSRHAIELAPGFEVRPSERVRIGVAPTVTLALSSTASHTDSLVSPREARFVETGLWTRPQPNGTPVAFNPLVVGLELAV